MKTLVRISVLAVLVGTLSGCFLTKLVTTPVRLVGSAGTVVGSALSILPVVGNPINDTFREANGAIDKVMDGVDDIPI
ncbi:hypothetical protein A167_00889 [Alcanivorax sp. S71-1-4]|uniref:DUF6726 family protein n=1 Tax=Alcanivorax sp. S71-1-4 TaxID=1177159 RepID=UPI00135A7818|nr:DUF6726 family protein [Alcanivorax sp. S71-1-4]KAF0810208.1 hypothetical protein A167_00889 [Alcanivorax sp. S71-1-4]